MRAFSAPLILFSLLAAVSPARADELEPLAKAIEANPEDKAAYDAYALQAFKTKQFDEAIRKLKIGVARIPDYGEGFYKLAYAYRQKREWADAADYYRRYIALNPQKTDAYFGLAASLQGLGDKKGAITAYDKYVYLEKAPGKQRFVDQAKAELIKLDPTRAPPPPVVVAPPPPPPVAALPPPPPVTPPPPAGPPRADAAQLKVTADQLRKDGKLDEAAAAYQRAIEADRGNVDLYNELGNVHFALKHYPEAAQAFRDATAREPNYALGWYNLAHALRKGDKKAEAVHAYRQYMRLKPDDPDPYYGLGQTLKALGDTPGAIEAFRKYVGMEKRPEEQRWVEKARAELEVLESMMRSRPTGAAPGSSGKIEDKGAADDLMRAASDRLERELERDRLAPVTDDLMNPFERGRGHLRDPFENEPMHDLKNPFDRDRLLPLQPPLSAVPEKRQLREYGAAIEAYRRALSRQVEDVSVRYERGVALVLADDARNAVRAWNSVMLADPRVESAKKSIARVRSLFASISRPSSSVAR